MSTAAVKRKADALTHANCMFWMDRKRRFCGLNRTPGTKFCGVHMPEASHELMQSKRQRQKTAERRERIPCPHDPNHTIYACNLRKHEKSCPAVRLLKKMRAQVFFCEACNSGTSSGTASSTVSSELQPAALGRLIEDAFVRAAQKLDLPREFLDNERQGTCAALSTDAPAPAAAVGAAAEPLAEELAALRPASTASLFADVKQQKHQIQQASIIGHLQKKGVLPTSAASAAEACPTVFVEFGAGRGMLSSAIDVALPGANVLLVERDGVRNKADRSLRYRVGTTEGASAAEGATASSSSSGGSSTGASASASTCNAPLFHRVRIDIRHLKLDRVPVLSADGLGAALRPVAGVGKHLCGVATDLTLRCLDDYSGPLTGFAVAQCCHHLCTFDDYCGREWLEKELGVGPADWERVRRATSWAVGYRSAERRGASSEASAARECVRVGRMAKRLLECGRVAYMRSKLNLNASLVHFCPASVTPENVLLIAWQRAPEKVQV
jgi:tRNA:m4X modification enzyme